MNKIIKADLRRIIKKKNLWVFLVLSCLNTIGFHIKDIALGTMNSFNFMTTSANSDMFTLLVGAVFLLAIYGDEFRSKAMTTIIGRGYSRTGVVLVKFLDTVILTVILFLFITLFTFVTELIFGIHMSADEVQFVLHSFIIGAYNLIGNLTLAALFIYITENVTLSVFIYVMFNMIIPLIGRFARTMSPVVEKFNLDRYDYSAMGRIALADLSLGITGDAILKLAIGCLYLAVVLVITIVFFNKKELDF